MMSKEIIPSILSYGDSKFTKIHKDADSESANDRSEDDEIFSGVAKNLLDIRETMRWDSTAYGTHLNKGEDGMEGKGESSISITKLFEPKFLDVFTKYCEYINQSLNTSYHLMSLCLENLIPFCCWARENNTRSDWLRGVLDENPDLRPEVRNGLSMILIYTMSTAKASHFKDLDMFGVLQEVDTGLGIVNKTSLKIYNDPFNYFNFIKSCMSGLIDCGKVPENERHNQPKKSKKLSENKDELMAFMQLKSVLVSFFNNGEHLTARMRIQQISHVWQLKQKNIRNRRFATALLILSSPLNAIQPNALAFPGMEVPFDPANKQHYSILPPSNNIVGSTPYTPQPFSSQHPQFSSALDNGEAARSLSSLAAVSAGVLEGGIGFPPGYPALHSSVGVPRLHSTMSSSGASGSSPVPSGSSRPVHPTGGHFQPHHNDQNGRPLPSSGVSHHFPQFNKQVNVNTHSAVRAPAMNVASPRMFPSIPAIRFERVGGKEWECKESKIYNIESLVLHNNSVFCLVDEAKLTTEERVQKKVFSQSSGFVSLQAELQQRGALVTSWPKTDHNHMLDFLESWMAQTTNVSLLDFWLHNSMNDALVERSPVSVTGVIVYEAVMQVGVVIRKNEALGIAEDCWRLIYPRDLHTESMSITLGAFLSSFFPQLRSVLAKLNGELGAVVVKYFPHKIEPPVTQAPKMEPVTAYQTIGTLDELCSNVLTRFDTNLAFHDIVLLST